MEDRIAALEARIAELERKVDHKHEHLLGITDLLDDTLMAVEIWEDQIILPSLLLLAGHGYRREIEAMLRRAEAAGDHLEIFERRPTQRNRLEHWRGMAKSIGPAPSYPPPDF